MAMPGQEKIPAVELHAPTAEQPKPHAGEDSADLGKLEDGHHRAGASTDDQVQYTAPGPTLSSSLAGLLQITSLEVRRIIKRLRLRQHVTVDKEDMQEHHQCMTHLLEKIVHTVNSLPHGEVHSPKQAKEPPSPQPSDRTIASSQHTLAVVHSIAEGLSGAKFLSKEELGRMVEDFIMSICKCLREYGCPTHKLEYHMVHICKGIGLNVASVGIHPDHVMITFARDSPCSYLAPVSKILYFECRSGYDMHRLELVDEIARKIASYGSINPFDPETCEDLGLPSDDLTLLSDPHSPVSSRPRSLRDIFPDEDVSEKGSKRSLKSQSHQAPTSSPSSISNPLPSISRLTSEPKRQLASSAWERIKKLKSRVLYLAANGPGFFNHLSMLQGDPKVEEYTKAFLQIAVGDASRRLNEVMKAKNLYPFWVEALSLGLASGSASTAFFAGSWADVASAFVLGTIVGFLSWFSTNPQFLRVYPVIAAFVVGFFSVIINHEIVPLCYRAVQYGAVITLVMGVTITLSMVELVTRNILAGTVRLFYGITITVLLGVGLQMGSDAASYILSQPTLADYLAGTCTDPIPRYWTFLWFPLSSIAFSIYFRAHWRQLPFMTFVATVGYLVSTYTRPQLGTNIASAFAAFCVGLVANIYNRWTGKPAVISLIAGITVLVPGTMALHATSQLQKSELFEEGLKLVMNVIYLAFHLAIGAFLASLVVLPRHTLLVKNRTSRYMTPISSMNF